MHKNYSFRAAAAGLWTLHTCTWKANKSKKTTLIASNNKSWFSFFMPHTTTEENKKPFGGSKKKKFFLEDDERLLLDRGRPLLTMPREPAAAATKKVYEIFSLPI